MNLYLNTKCLKILIIFSIFVWVLITIIDRYFLIKNYELKYLRPEGKRTLIQQIHKNHKTHIILFWTKYFWQSIESHLNNKTIDSEFCSGVIPLINTSCVVTSDRAYHSFSRALVFHWRDLSLEDMPPFRRSDQLWTLYNLEAPTHTHNIFSLFGGSDLSFNITSSYRTDSDIYVPYGRLVKTNRKSNENNLNFIEFESKTKQIVWFVSNCETPSKRELYVRELNRYISVDIYGKCGSLSCDPPRSQSCFERVSKEYKFYLSFENSICRDYVTEKLFEALNYNILPIVFGGSDYKSWMPYKSFIDATLMTPKQLADHLVEIGSKKHKYLSYFQWKHNFNLKSGLDQNFEVFCHLCKILNDFKIYESHSSNDLINWWFKTSECKSWVNSVNNRNNYINIFR